MSKKKNTLKDLDEFLKQQAATLVEPTDLRDTIRETPSAQKTPLPSGDTLEITAATVLDDLKRLAAKEGSDFRSQLCMLIIQSLESQKTTSAEDKMLINTALYLTHGTNWKEAIKNYWEKR